MLKKPIYILHPYLTKISFYKSWHEFKYHNHFHWAIFLLYSLTILALVFSFSLGFLSPPKKIQAQIYTVRPGHPRLYLTPDNLEMIRNRCVTTHSAEYKRLLRRMDDWYQKYQFHIDVLNFAFLYKIGVVPGVEYKHSPEEYGQWAKKIFLEKLVNNPDYLAEAEGYFPQNIILGVGYDWLYDLLSDGEKKAVVDAIITHNDYIIKMDTVDTSNADMATRSLRRRFYVLGGLAFYGDGINDTKAKEYVDKFETRWRNGVLAARELQAGDDGGWRGGFAYAHLDIWRTVRMIDAWYTATGENWYAKSNFLRYYPQWYLYMLKPWNGNFKIADDGGLDWDFSTSFPDIIELQLIASRYNELGETDMPSLVKWLENKLAPLPTSGSFIEWGNYVWYILWNNKNIPAKSPSMLNLPLTKKFDGLGWVFMRTGFESANDTAAVFIAQPYIYCNHDNRHQNSFIIRKKGDLALDSGSYDGEVSHDVHYSKRTIAHNTIIIYDPNENFGGISNDGGQRSFYNPTSYTDYQPGSIWDVGPGITEFESSSEYDYILGDATNAYNSSKLSKFTRQFVYLRPQADGKEFFVIFDRVNSTNASFPKRWLLHMSFEPTIKGTGTLEREGKTVYQNADLVTTTNGAGRLFSKTLLPKAYVINKIGGPGHEFEDAEGNNWPIPSYRTYQDWMGAWRIEVEPTIPQNYDLFLHVLQPTDTSVSEMAPSSKIESTDGNMVGAKVEDRLVLFGKNGKYQGQVKYTLTGSGKVKNLLVNLIPNIKYTKEDKNLSNNQSTSEEIQASNQGTLSFETELLSDHQITLTPYNQPIISLTKAVDKSQAQKGEILTYTITYKNIGNQEAKEVTIEDTIPTGTTYQEGGTYNSTTNKVKWEIGSVASGGTGSVEFKVKVE